MSERAPNGYFIRDLLVFNHLRRGGVVSKGFIFEAPDLTNSPVADLNAFQDQLCLLLASLNENQRLQVQYFCDSDYKGELLRYQQETERFTNLWTKRSRNERFTRYWQAMAERRLRRQRVILYISRSLENTPKSFQSSTARRKYYSTLLDQLQSEFEHVQRLLLEIFSATGARILPMSDLDHFRHWKRFLNPSLNERFDYDPADGFVSELSIQENCWHSEGNGQCDFGFFLDGHYHSLIVLTRWPRTTYPGIIQRLTNLRLLDYTITVNVDPLPVSKEINKEEKEHDRVAGDYASEKKISLLTVMEKKQKKIHALMQGQTIPFHAMLVIRVWDKTRDGLNAKAGAIKNAVNSMNGAQYFESNLPSTSRSLFFQTWPGWLWGRYEFRKLYAEHRYLADMLPVTSTFTGHLGTAEAIYDGPGSNLVGIETFSGSEDNKSPQHAVLLGMSGAGKSVTVCDLLTQTEGYFGYTVIRVGFIGDPDLVVRGKNTYAAKITDTALGTIRSLESTIQVFEDRAGKLETAVGDAQKRATELEGRVGAPFEREERYQELTRRQSEIEERLDLTKNQAPSQVAAFPPDENTEAPNEKQTTNPTVRPKRLSTIRI